MWNYFFEYPFLIRAMAGVFLVAVICSLMGTFVVFNKMSFFTDAIAHSALTGIAIGLLIGVQPFWTALVFGVIIALLVVYLKNNSKLTIDSVLGLFLPFSMAFGIILLSFKKGYTPDIMSYLFGSVLAVSWFDVAIEVVVLLLILVWFWFYYQKMLYLAFDLESAKIAGIKTILLEYLFVFLLSLVTITGIQIVGIALIGALIVIPAAAAKNMAASFFQMLIWSLIIGLMAGIIGMLASLMFNFSSGASIVLAATGIFVISFIFRRK